MPACISKAVAKKPSIMMPSTTPARAIMMALSRLADCATVSYTHLTLPTIYSV